MIKGLYEAHLPVRDLKKSIDFYQNLGLELASTTESYAFFWIEKGKSWLGLWEGEQVDLPYHVSIRHVAFQVDSDDLDQAKEWLKERGVEVNEFFGFSPDRQPLILPNNPQVHAAIYFEDPDGNLLEFISPLRIDVKEELPMMELHEWKKRDKS
ncbi:VOC family protein [Shimazuella sp. AN120528]|uniref:VOC family protein n=1 Tax=Shimazuella soli TaxID=1892854 RepID=UPI001F0F286E|nr:VOC family protein [Shimazuella soli]MCH5586561.1 VOC family protein [Shimazuella soli]